MTFEIYGKIQGKERPRFAKGHVYTPQATKNYEELISLSFLQKCDNTFSLSDTISIKITAFFEIPKSYSKKRKEEIFTNFEFPTRKPDIDNIAKIVLDGLNGIAYTDDSKVARLYVEKKYTIDNERLEVDVFKICY